jgi:hypothetical protein
MHLNIINKQASITFFTLQLIPAVLGAGLQRGTGRSYSCGFLSLKSPSQQLQAPHLQDIML